MNYKYGNMWDVYAENNIVFCITTNSYVKKNGALVMGRGIAKTARDNIGGLDMRLGKRITNSCGHLGKYYLLPDNETKVCAFQVKTIFNHDAQISLIKNSLIRLNHIAKKFSGHEFHLNFPGIGNGGLSKRNVKPLIDNVLREIENVTIWQFNHQKSNI